jgi:hypothetical protein
MVIRSLFLRAWLLLMLTAAVVPAQKYTGPRPPKPDVLYLVHADNLIPTETAQATEESKKNEVTYTVPGTSSPARTPLAEPIFIIQTEKIQADRLELYKMDVKSGKRVVSMTRGKRGGSTRAYHLSVTKLDTNLYRIEAGEVLENGPYSISPNDSNIVFCFDEF